MADNRNKTKMNSPKGVAIYPKLNAPDTKFDAAGKFTTKLQLDGNDAEVQGFVAKLEGIRDAYFEQVVADLIKDKKAALAKELGKDAVIKVERDQETGDETGNLIFSASMKASGTRKDGSSWTQKPDLFDGKGNKLTNPPAIWGGSELRLSVEVEPFVNQTSKKVALSVRLKAAKIIKLRTGGGSGDASDYGFDDDEGEEIANVSNESPFGDDADAGSNSTQHDDL